MAFIGFRHKLTSAQLGGIHRRGASYYLNNREIKELELCGVLISGGERYFTICDFHGETSLFKSPELAIPEGSCLLILRPFERSAKTAFYCKSATKVTLYEEMAFNLEVCALSEGGCYC